MTTLLNCLGFIVLDRVVAPDDVARALPSPSTRQGVAPRRLALAETIHEGDENDANEKDFAILTHAGKTLIAKPGWYTRTGVTTLDVALSTRFGLVFSFHSHWYCPSILRFRDGQPDGEVSEEEVTPEEGLFGKATRLHADDAGAVMRTYLAGYVGAPWGEIFPRAGATAELWRFE